MNHKHTWARSTREHRRPPRFFVVCKDPACGVVRQAVITEGYTHTFATGKKGLTEPMRNYSIRLPRKPTRDEIEYFRAYLRNNSNP